MWEEGFEGTYHGDWNCRGVREHKLDFLEFCSPAPVLCQCDPACTTVTQAVSHDYGRGVLLNCGDDEGGWLRWHNRGLMLGRRELVRSIRMTGSRYEVERRNRLGKCDSDEKKSGGVALLKETSAWALS